VLTNYKHHKKFDFHNAKKRVLEAKVMVASLSWQSADDLDLHVLLPGATGRGEKLFPSPKTPWTNRKG